LQNNSTIFLSPICVAACHNNLAYRYENLGYKNLVELLVHKGADIGALDNDGKTVLHQAVRGGHKDVVRLLVSKGAGVGAVDKGGLTTVV
jgi:ankyrin repeat protein